MQEKEKKRTATWAGFEGENGIEYVVYLRAERIHLVAKELDVEGTEETNEIDLSITDFKHMMAVAQGLLLDAGDGVLRYPDKDATRG